MIPQHFVTAKQEFLDKAGQMGMDLYQVQDFVERHGIFENNFEIILD